MWGVCVDLTFHIFWVNNSKCTCQIIQQMNSYFLRSLLNCTGLERVPTAVPLAESRRLCHYHRCGAFGNWVGFVYLLFYFYFLSCMHVCAEVRRGNQISGSTVTGSAETVVSWPSWVLRFKFRSPWLSKWSNHWASFQSLCCVLFYFETRPFCSP